MYYVFLILSSVIKYPESQSVERLYHVMLFVAEQRHIVTTAGKIITARY